MGDCGKRSRFQVKSRKNNPESKLKPCPYNATEYIHPGDLAEHLKNCTSAKLLKSQKYMAKESYIDAPFHMPKQKVEEDFEGREVRVNDADMRVLERSISQMSLVSNEPPNRASSLQGVGRGYALAHLTSRTHQMDGKDELNEEELDACDNVSVKITKNNLRLRTYRLCFGEAPEPGEVYPLYSESEDDEVDGAMSPGEETLDVTDVTPDDAKVPSGIGRGAMLELLVAEATNNPGQPHHFNQTVNQNYPTQQDRKEGKSKHDSNEGSPEQNNDNNPIKRYRNYSDNCVTFNVRQLEEVPCHKANIGSRGKKQRNQRTRVPSYKFNATHRLRYPQGLNWSSMLTNPFEKPVAFGPPQTSHLEYRSHKPLDLS